MAYITTFLALVLAVGAAHCSDLVRLRSSGGLPTRQNIYDGKKTTIQKVPYLIAYLWGDDEQFLCAGAIVSSSWTTTFGDAAAYIDTSSQVLAGSNDSATGTKHYVKTVVLHPNFDQAQFDYDYVLVQIAGKFKWSAIIKPAKLPKTDLKLNAKVVVAGWGDTGGDIGRLKEGTMKWYSTKVCAELYAPLFPWNARLACVYNKGKTTVCQGDFGDPFVAKGVLYGHMITGLDDGFCTSTAQPTVINDIAAVAEWIRNTTGATFEDEEFGEDDE